MSRHTVPPRPKLRRTARVGTVTVLGAAVVTTAFALPAAASTVHVVERGDTLSAIAKAAGLSSWVPVYNANPSVTDPDLIRPGQRLTVPEKGERVAFKPRRGGRRWIRVEAPTRRSWSSSRSRTTSRRTSAAAGGGRNGVWDRLAACESGGDWGTNTGNGYYGGLQFSSSTWRSLGGSGVASQASRAKQIQIAKRLQRRSGWEAWPACSRKLGLR
jgi:LysM repeat protein